jgi:carotenoid cleavage dioxygenase
MTETTVHTVDPGLATANPGPRFGLTSPWECYYHPAETATQGRFEAEIDELVVYGEIPKEISGTWYRILIDPHFTPQPNTPFVDGDGNVSAFRIQDGKVSMKIKYVETERWLLERQAGRRLFGRYRNSFDNHPCVRLANDSTGNTNIIYWGGNLLALAERGLPWALDPDTLETKGADPYGGQVNAKTFAAHPKVDPHKNEIVTWSYAAKGLSTRDICIYSIDPDGKTHNEVWYKQDKPGWPHDGWITDNWVILSNMPFTTNSDEVMKAGGDYWRYVPGQPSELLVTPRKGSKMERPDWRAGEMRKYTAPHGLIIHTGNAWEEDDGILKLDSHLTSFNVFDFFDPEGYVRPEGRPTGDWVRWTIDTHQPDGTAVPPAEILAEGVFDFPIFDERMTGRKTKIAYLGQMIVTPRRPTFNGVVKLNTDTGEKWIFRRSEDSTIAEPAYIPRGPDCEEGDGWIIFYSEQETAPCGELVLLDTNDFTKPVAIMQLPFRLRNQVHGNWVPNPHPETPLPSLTRPIKKVIPSTKYSQINRLD